MKARYKSIDESKLRVSWSSQSGNPLAYFKEMSSSYFSKYLQNVRPDFILERIFRSGTITGIKSFRKTEILESSI